MAKSKKVAVVTGANRGIGLEVCQQLAEKGLKVVLTARDAIKGKKAADKLRKANLDVVFHQLDVTDEKSILVLAKYLKKKFGKIDVLVNNAGVSLDGRKTVLNVDMGTVRKTLDINLLGPLRVSQVIAPLIRKRGIIINVSSEMGSLQWMEKMGGGYASYSISKTAVNAVTKKLSSALKQRGISVNSVHPGWVRTDMGGPQATKSVKKGAETIVWLATAAKVPTGKFLEDKKEIPW